MLKTIINMKNLGQLMFKLDYYLFDLKSKEDA